MSTDNGNDDFWRLAEIAEYLRSEGRGTNNIKSGDTENSANVYCQKICVICEM